MRFLGMVKVYAGRLEPIDSPRGESIFVTWSPKIFIEASAWRAYESIIKRKKNRVFPVLGFA